MAIKKLIKSFFCNQQVLFLDPSILKYKKSVSLPLLFIENTQLTIGTTKTQQKQEYDLGINPRHGHAIHGFIRDKTFRIRKEEQEEEYAKRQSIKQSLNVLSTLRYDEVWFVFCFIADLSTIAIPESAKNLFCFGIPGFKINGHTYTLSATNPGSNDIRQK